MRDIPGYEGRYAVTRDGRVWSYKTKRFRKNQTNRYGYPCVMVIKDGKFKLLTVHRLVALTYIPNPGNKPYVNHIDFNRSNPSVSNLEWCTPAENHHHTMRHGRNHTGINFGLRNGNAKFSREVINQILNDPLPHRTIATKYGISRGYVSKLKALQFRISDEAKGMM